MSKKLNATRLRDKLAEVMEKLLAEDINVGAAGAYANLAGKMISSAATQVRYYELQKHCPDIPFLNEGE